MNLLAILRDAWFFYSRHFLLIVRLCLPLILTEAAAHQLADVLSDGRPHVVVSLGIGLLFYPIYSAALIFLLDSRSRGLEIAPGRLLAMSLQRWAPMAILTAISSLLVLLGVSLLILPGIWLMIKLAFCEFFLLQRGLSPLAAIRASFELTGQQIYLTAACVAVVVIPLWALNLTLGAFSADATPLINAALDGALGLAQMFSTVVFFRLYMLSAPQTTGEPNA